MNNITSKEISLQSISMLQHFEKDFEFDETIPDHLPNIKEVLCVYSSVAKKELSYDNDRLVAEITLRYKLFYISDINDNLCVYSFLHKMNHKTDEKKTDNAFYIINVQPASPNVRSLNQRKIFIKSKMSIDILKVSNHTHNTISDAQQNCCVKTLAISPTTTTELCNESITFEDVITLGDGYDPIDSILDINATVTNCESEFVSGYINIKGNASLSMIYLSELDRDKIIRVERQMSFDKSIPCISNIDECECIGSFSIQKIDASPQIDTYGEYRTVNVEYSLNADVKGVANRFDSVVNDIFSPGMSESISKDNISFSKLTPLQDKLLLFEDTVSTDELSFNRIISSRANIFISSRTDESIDGSVDIYIIGETSEGFKCFMAKKEFTESIPEAPSLISAECIECNVSIAGSSTLSYKVIGKASLLSFTDEDIDIINNVEFSDISEARDNLIIYYPSSNEAIWDISKKYHVAPESIKAANPSIAGDKITNNEILVIKKK